MRCQSHILTVIIIIVASLLGCKREDNLNNIPNVFVQEFVYLNNPSSFNLNTPGGWVYNPGGFSGLVVYRRNFTNAFDDFIAWDRACPLHFNESCGTMNVVDNLFLECPCDGQQFLMFDGMPIDGKAPQMRFYTTFFDGVNVIRITN